MGVAREIAEGFVRESSAVSVTLIRQMMWRMLGRGSSYGGAQDRLGGVCTSRVAAPTRQKA